MTSYYGQGSYGAGQYSLAPEIDLSGNLAYGPLLGPGSMGVILAFSGNLSFAPTFWGSTGNVADFGGALEPTVALSQANMAVTFGMQGAIEPAIAFAGAPTVIFSLSGNLSVTPAIALDDAGSTDQPLWNPDPTPCPEPAWEPDYVTEELTS